MEDVEEAEDSSCWEEGMAAGKVSRGEEVNATFFSEVMVGESRDGPGGSDVPPVVSSLSTV